MFIDLRDASGVVQVVVDPVAAPEAAALGRELRDEYCIALVGKVRVRPAGITNPDLPTGEIEVAAAELRVLSPSDPLPFQIDDRAEIDELRRLAFRYLDLRRPRMAANLRARSKGISAMRRALVGRAERRALREQVTDEMLPRAFTRSRRTLLYVDTEGGWLVVDAASAAQAEEAVSLLRQTLETLPAKPPAPRNPPAVLLTAWLLDGSAPADSVPAEACELRDSEDSGRVIRCKGQDLGSEDIRNLLRAGMQVVKLALNWDERLSFVLADDLSLKSLRVGDAHLETVEDADDPVARLDAEFALLALQLRALFTRLDTLFGLATNEAPGG